MIVLVTGATGYIGGRLVPRLLAAGHEVRVLVRAWDSVRGRPWESKVRVVRGDLLNADDAAALDDALRGVDAAYYLVHSMYAGSGFAERDRQAAGNFVAAVRRTSGATNPRDATKCTAATQALQPRLPHLIYLGGLQPDDEGKRSGHLSSRAEVGRILADGLPGHTTEFRAGPIIGSGSASFEMVRYLTERLPVMVTPRWV